MEQRFGSGDEHVVALVVRTVRHRTRTPHVGVDLDADLAADLGIAGRHRYEIAGELAEAVDLPGLADDDLNAHIIERLAACASIRSLVEHLVGWQDPRAYFGISTS